MGEKEIVEDGGGGVPRTQERPHGGVPPTTGRPLVDPTGGGTPPPTQPGGGVPQTQERKDPCKDLTAKAQELLQQLQSAHDANRAAMQRALNAFYGARSNPNNDGYAHWLSSSEITKAVVDANNATGKMLIDVALFAAGGWGGIAGEGSAAADIFGTGLSGAKSAADAWGKIGIKVAGKVADAYIGDKAGTLGSAAYKSIDKAIGDHGDDATKVFQGPAGAIESIVRGKVLDALGDWMKDGATSGDLSRAQAAYADFCAAAAVCNTTEGAGRSLKQQIDDVNGQLRAQNCPEVTIPDYVFYTFDITQFGTGMYEGQAGPTMHAKNLVSGGDRATDLFAQAADVQSGKDRLPF